MRKTITLITSSILGVTLSQAQIANFNFDTPTFFDYGTTWTHNAESVGSECVTATYSKPVTLGNSGGTSTNICSYGWTTANAPDWSKAFTFNIEANPGPGEAVALALDTFTFTARPGSNAPANWAVRIIDNTAVNAATQVFTGAVSSSTANTTYTVDPGSNIGNLAAQTGENITAQLSFYNAPAWNPDGTEVRSYMWMEDATMTGTANCYNIPEPSSFALLGLGSLTLLRRKK